MSQHTSNNRSSLSVSLNAMANEALPDCKCSATARARGSWRCLPDGYCPAACWAWIAMQLSIDITNLPLAVTLMPGIWLIRQYYTAIHGPKSLTLSPVQLLSRQYAYSSTRKLPRPRWSGTVLGKLLAGWSCSFVGTCKDDSTLCRNTEGIWAGASFSTSAGTLLAAGQQDMQSVIWTASISPQHPARVVQQDVDKGWQQWHSSTGQAVQPSLHITVPLLPSWSTASTIQQFSLCPDRYSDNWDKYLPLACMRHSTKRKRSVKPNLLLLCGRATAEFTHTSNLGIADCAREEPKLSAQHWRREISSAPNPAVVSWQGLLEALQALPTRVFKSCVLHAWKVPTPWVKVLVLHYHCSSHHMLYAKPASTV